ncbi:phosphodiesterase [Nocardia uniformis]|uniref:Phosphodiesterase n=1 Tax=Nocardia uniformis TaxID=53432 RepID=A0A849BZI8_9NOCA|nr:metallophosphoesterase [Nocardia uniformis]NNH71734.1 phosphodiesterase [Nocardia uniformis]
MALLAHLSDTHFNTHGRNSERAERVMAFLADLPQRPDAIIVSGDIADEGRAEEYAQARVALLDGADVPVLILPGNHDDRSTMREVLFGQTPSPKPINQVHRVKGLTLVLLDSSIPGKPEGLLDDDTLTWLTDLLAATPADDSVVLALHHPPVAIHSTVVDPIRLTNPERLAEIVSGDDRIVGVLTGHAHVPITTVFAGKPLAVAPSVSSFIGNEWEVSAPGHVPIDYATDPALFFHFIADGRLLTALRPVPMGGSLSEPLE